MLSACTANESETVTTTMTSESASVTETETSIETENTTTAETTAAEAVSETEAATASETVTEASAESYEPDRNFEYTENFMSEEDKYINRPMFLGEPENTGAEVYVMFSDDVWEYYDPFWDETRETDSRVLIRHDGVTDIISAEWVERFREPFKLYSGDYDGDGEAEIAAVRYDTGGTICYVSYLTIFDKIDGHYKSYVFDQYGFISDNFSADIDMNTEKITFKVTGNSDYVYDTSGLFESKAEDISLGNLVDYTVDSDNISVTYGICIHLTESTLPEILNMNLDVNFKDGEFILSNAEYTEME